MFKHRQNDGKTGRWGGGKLTEFPFHASRFTVHAGQRGGWTGRWKVLLVALAGVVLAGCQARDEAQPEEQRGPPPTQTVVVETTLGDITIELDREHAPETVQPGLGRVHPLLPSKELGETSGDAHHAECDDERDYAQSRDDDSVDDADQARGDDAEEERQER